MSNLSLFGDSFFTGPALEMKVRLAGKLKALAEEGIYIGTSSWKYEGWLGQVYTPERYRVRGKFSRKKFEQEALAEYGETFPAVCGDFSFYQFPAPDYWCRLFSTAPNSLQFSFKAPEEVTVKWWPQHARYGPRAGERNSSFLDADVLESMFLEPLAPYRDRIGTIIFEFGTFGPRSYERSEEFLPELDQFLAKLPTGWRYSVEIRNRELLGPDYFGCLSSHGAAHVFNSWSRMPDLAAQLSANGSRTAGFLIVRALLRAGRSYEAAVKMFHPYTHIQDPNPTGRAGIRSIIRQARAERRSAYIFVNNRFEGNAPGTIEAILED
jgi:uncharacterized protein YecE (DUF72 family)